MEYTLEEVGLLDLKDFEPVRSSWNGLTTVSVTGDGNSATQSNLEVFSANVCTSLTLWLAGRLNRTMSPLTPR